MRSEDVLHVAPLECPSPDRGAIGVQFDVQRWRMETLPGVLHTADQVRTLLEPLLANVDLCEPFDRIRAALHEAQLSAPDAAEGPDDLAAAA
jgi:hypothetical protein